MIARSSSRCVLAIPDSSRQFEQRFCIKVANLDTAEASVAFELPFDSIAESGYVTYIAGAETDSNTPEQPDLVTPQTTSIDTGSTFNYTAPGSSFAVLVVGV